MTAEHDHNTTPPANKPLLALAVVLLLLPIVAILWVSTYARTGPELGGVPFFFWYQFVWVFLCAGATWSAYKIVLKARPHRPMTDGSAPEVPGDGSDR